VWSCTIGALKDGRLPGCSPHPPKATKLKLKNTDFVNIMISKVLRDLPLSQNQPLKSVDDRYIRNSKNKITKTRRQDSVIESRNR
jgi:hypothetical protein